jgi:hypothetical protein
MSASDQPKDQLTTTSLLGSLPNSLAFLTILLWKASLKTNHLHRIRILDSASMAASLRHKLRHSRFAHAISCSAHKNHE